MHAALPKPHLKPHLNRCATVPNPPPIPLSISLLSSPVFVTPSFLTNSVRYAPPLRCDSARLGAPGPRQQTVQLAPVPITAPGPIMYLQRPFQRLDSGSSLVTLGPIRFAPAAPGRRRSRRRRAAAALPPPSPPPAHAPQKPLRAARPPRGRTAARGRSAPGTPTAGKRSGWWQRRPADPAGTCSAHERHQMRPHLEWWERQWKNII